MKPAIFGKQMRKERKMFSVVAAAAFCSDPDQVGRFFSMHTGTREGWNLRHVAVIVTPKMLIPSVG